MSYWKNSSQGYRKLVIGLLLFTLFNSSDFFLLLKLKENGLSDTLTVGAYIFYNLVYATMTFPLRKLANRLGLKKVFLFGLFIFAIVYLGMALTNNTLIFFIIFFLYGIYAAVTEGISKTWISNITEKKDTTTAIGTFTGFQSICTMIASSLAGILWFNFGASKTFIVTAVMIGFTFIYVFLLKPANA